MQTINIHLINVRDISLHILYLSWKSSDRWSLRPMKWVQWDRQGQRSIQSVKLYEQSGLILPETLGTLSTFKVTLIWERKWQREITTEMQAQLQICKFKEEEPIRIWPEWFLWTSKPAHVPNYIPLFPVRFPKCSALTFS